MRSQKKEGGTHPSNPSASDFVPSRGQGRVVGTGPEGGEGSWGGGGGGVQSGGMGGIPLRLASPNEFILIPGSGNGGKISSHKKNTATHSL